MTPRTSLAAISGLGFLACLLSPALSTAEDRAPRFGEAIDVRVVNVEVVVEDAKGRRVTGLGADSFRLLVDGQETPITYFTEVRDGRAVGAGDGGAPGVPAIAAGEPVGRSFLVFVDDYFSIGAQRNLVLARLRDEARALGPKDRMAVVAFAGRQLDLLTDWTGSPDTLTRVFDEAAHRPAFGLLRFSERWRRDVPVFPSREIDFFPHETHFELEREAAAVVSTLRGFASAPGRKILILLAGGWPGFDINPYDPTVPVGAYENDLQVLLSVVETANLLGFTVYPIDVSGLRTTGVESAQEFAEPTLDVGGFGAEAFTVQGLASPEVQSVLLRGTPAASGLALTRSRYSDSALQLEIFRQSTLRAIARGTGGTALFAGDRRWPLSSVVDDTASYYWLGFEPRRQRDDRRHELRVELRDGEHKVRARRTFRDLSREVEVAMDTQGAALFRGSAPRFDLRLELGEPERLRGRKMEVQLRIFIPPGRLTFLPAESGYTTDAELRLAAVDRYGGQSEVPIVPVHLVYAVEPGPEAVVAYETSITLRRERHDLAVSVYDRLTGQLLVATASVEPPTRR